MRRVAGEARLGDWRGQGYLELVTEGYVHIEGVFFALPATFDAIQKAFRDSKLLDYRGPCWFSETPDICSRKVHIRAFKHDGGRVRVRIEAVAVGDMPG